MFDILKKPKNLVHSRDMVGHVTLELRNVKTGRRERIAKHNLITSHADEWLWLNMLSGLTRPDSVYGGLYGGVCLFKSALPTAGTNRLPFGNNHLVGYAGDSTSAEGQRGVFNQAESQFNVTEGVAKTVWDWGTAQANDTIAAVARTHVVIGNGTFGNHNNGGSVLSLIPADNTSDEYQVIGFNKTLGKLYCYRNSDHNYYECDYSEYFTVARGVITQTYYPKKQSLLTKICDGAAIGSNAHRWYDQTNHKIYSMNITVAGSGHDGEFDLYVIDLNDPTPVESVTHVTMTGCYLYTTGNTGYCCLSDGYGYLSGYDPNDLSKYGVYQIELADITNIDFYNTTDLMTGKGYGSVGRPSYIRPWGTGGISGSVQGTKGGTTYYKEFCLEQDGTFLIEEPGLLTSYNDSSFRTAYGSPAVGDSIDTFPFLMRQETYSSPSPYLVMARDYMATIANLSPAVTKTASETLKLTYTLTDQ